MKREPASVGEACGPTRFFDAAYVPSRAPNPDLQSMQEALASLRRPYQMISKVRNPPLRLSH
jgi:hypothetical protein